MRLTALQSNKLFFAVLKPLEFNFLAISLQLDVLTSNASIIIFALILFSLSKAIRFLAIEALFICSDVNLALGALILHLASFLPSERLLCVG